MKKIVASQHVAALSFAKLTVESEAGEGAMPRATGWSAQILRTRGCVNARMNILTKREAVAVGIHLEAINCENLGHETNPWPSIYLNDDIQGAGDVVFVPLPGGQTAGA